MVWPSPTQSYTGLFEAQHQNAIFKNWASTSGVSELRDVVTLHKILVSINSRMQENQIQWQTGGSSEQVPLTSLT